ncbi:hypothetical protein Igag_1397 [Ignisphaera aggregans DSM 17230]|uniref:Uncharacterized protein n=1 Tax=Ignisphaera aggregans (strain DSM 17230 / JCM 13409 / AQ1.S1) TaxID=583356 RepID=E0SQE4_IGNAA|nr:hypothetical protein Igag_1397 [Ignisphaera aggregans DSM 17230]
MLKIRVDLRSFTNIRKRVGSKESSLEDTEVLVLANILTNMILMGKDKRRRCIFYNHVDGLCTFLKFDVAIPTLTMVKVGDGYRVNVANNPEVCAVCPYWRERR